MDKNINASNDLSQQGLEEITLNKNFEERSEVAQEIISRKLDFFEKWALSVFLILLMTLIASTWFIRYPDIVEANAMLTSINALKEIVSKQSGKLTALFVKNNDHVKQGEILAWIETSANTKEVIDLSIRLDNSVKKLESDRPESIAELINQRFINLGELQVSYQRFITAWQVYNDYLINGFYSKKKKMLYNDITSLQNIKAQVSAQRELTEEDNALAKNTFEMNQELYDQKVISAEEYRQAKSTLLNKQQSLPRIDVSIISQQNQIREKQKEINQLNHDILQQRQTFEQSLQTLKSNVDEWLKEYIIRAPTDGMVVFTLPLQKNQYLPQGKLLGYINPPISKYYAEIKLSQNNFGKVDTGMKVQLRFDAYPYYETGFLQGTLSYISSVSADSFFLGTVRLDHGLTTNQHKSIQFKSGLKAQTLIITKDMSLLQRLCYSIVKANSGYK